MLNKNAKCQIRRVTEHDMYGQPQLGAAINEDCAIVKLRREMKHTTVRADSSQSRGHGDEFVSTNRVHLDANTIAMLGDQLIVAGVKLKITAMNPQYDVRHGIDHYQVEGELWE
jgi:hypothetical protein